MKKPYLTLLSLFLLAGCQVSHQAPQAFLPSLPVQAGAVRPQETDHEARLRQFAIDRWKLWYEQAYDDDGDGRLTWEEFHDAGWPDNPETRRFFASLDLDGDGGVSFEEFKVSVFIDADLRYFIRFGDMMVSRLDQNNDKKLSLKEYLRRTYAFSFDINETRLVPNPNPNIRHDAFFEADTNQDELLSDEEGRELLGRTMAQGYVHSIGYTDAGGKRFKAATPASNHRLP